MAEASAPVGGAERGMGDGFAPFRQNWGGRPKPETATVFPLGPSKRIYASWRRRVAHAEIGAYGEPHGDRLTNWITHISDRCACQFMCADHFGTRTELELSPTRPCRVWECMGGASHAGQTVVPRAALRRFAAAARPRRSC